MDADKRLIYSCEQFRDILSEDAEVTQPGAGLPDWEPYPSLHVLAQFASAVYYDNNTSLPNGWKLLTSARNPGKTNGYFGAAYWCPSQQQVVLAHRGTIPTNPGALYTNMIGVVFTNYSPRMISAITFADNVKQVLREINDERSLRIHLSITGHSLGGWLAQVTAFTLKFLRREGDRFCKIQDCDEYDREGLHAHAVVFDSPGCRNMLEEIVDSYDFRYRKTVSLKTLDISVYLSAPNNINTFGLHAGEVYRVLIDVSKFGFLQKHTPKYTFATHSVDNFVEAFENKRIIRKMLDWPVSSPLRNKEYKKFHTMVSHASEYHLEPAEDHQMQLRYKPEGSENSHSLRIFSDDELQFLNFWTMFKKDNMRLSVMEAFLESYKLGTVQDLLDDFEIKTKNHTIVCNSKESLEKIVKRTKQLMRWFGTKLMDAVRHQSAIIPQILYFTANQNYLNFLPEFLLDFRDAIGLQDFLESNSRQLLYIETEDSQFEAALLYNIFCLLQRQWKTHSGELRSLDNYLPCGKHTFLDWKRMLELEETVDFENLRKSEFTNDNLLVVDCTSVTDVQIITNLTQKILKHFGENIHKKVIIILSNKHRDIKIDVSVKSVNMSDLTEDSQKKLFVRKLLAFKNEKLSLQQCVGSDLVFEDFLKNIQKSSFIDIQRLNRVVTEQNYTVEIEDIHLKFINLDVHYSKIEKEVSVKIIARIFRKYSPKVLLVIIGLNREELNTNRQWKELAEAEQGAEERIFTSIGDGELVFKQKCHENPNLIIYWIEATDAHIYCKQVFDKGFYIGRRFKHTVVIDLCIVDKVIEKRDVKDVFVFQNVTDKRQLLELLPLSREHEDIFLNDCNFQTAATSEQADAIIKNTRDRPVHILKLQESGGPRLVWRASRGSLDNLRPYVTAGGSEPIDERELCSLSRNEVVIIVDEPGMGKSTSLMNMSWLIESAWVIFINLKYLQTDILPAKLSVAAVTTFFLLKNHTDDSLVCKMLQHCLKFENSIPVFLLMDGFDEIKEPSVRQEVLRLLKFLKDETTASIFLTSREYPRKCLENELSVFATTFEEISIRHQREFLEKFLRSHLELELEDFGEEEEGKLRKYVERLYRDAKAMLGVDITHFMGIPLQMRMLSEVSLSEAKLFIKSSGVAQNLFQITDVFELYQKFINTKYDIYFEEKSEISGLSRVNKKVLLKDKIKKHLMLGFLTIFPDFAKKTLKLKSIENDDLIEMNRIGLIQLSGDGDSDFIHRTFAEFFSAEFLLKYLSKYDELVELLLFEVLLQPKYHITRMFFSYLIRLYPLNQRTLQLCTEKCGQLWDTNRSVFFSQHQNAFHIAADERNEQIFDFLLRILNTEATQEAYISLISERDLLGRTALNIAAADIDKDSFCSESDRIIFSNIMEKIILSVEDCSFEFKQKLLLATFIKRRIYKILIEHLKHAEGMNSVFERTQNILDKQSYSFLEAVKENNQHTMEEIYKKMTNNTEQYYLLLAADSLRDTALHIAATRGYSELVTFLINQNVPINVLMTHNNVGRTPLHSAAAAGHSDIVALLVKRGADIHDLDRDDRSALSLAAFMGHLPVVTFLVWHRANLNSRDQSGRTALSLAAFKGHVSVVESLVRTGRADINSQDLQGRSALSWAACGGSLPVVKFLVKTGKVDINSRDLQGRSALSWAASGGHLSVVEFLVSTEQSDIDSLDEHLRTALSWAACEGQLSVVKFLISTGKVNINARDEQGRSALCWAACKGRESVVEFIVATEQSDNNSRDIHGRTPLSWAASAGHISVVNCPVSVGRADINSQDERGRSVMSWAVCEGQQSIVEFLIAHERVDINSRDNQGRSALSWAACRGHLPVLELLIQNKAEIILPDSECISFLLRLACCGKLWALELLMEHQVMIPVEYKDRDDILWMPNEDLLSEVFNFLILHKENICFWKESGKTAVQMAAQSGNFPVIVYLVWQGIHIDYHDDSGKSALHLASESGHIRLVKFLLGRDRKDWAAKMFNKYNAHLRWRTANPNSVDKTGLTILQCVCRDGRWEVAQELLDAGADVNPNYPQHRSPLQCALDAENWSLVESMLKKGANTRNLSEEQISKLRALNFL